MDSNVGTPQQINTTLEVLGRLSRERYEDGIVQDAIKVVQTELRDIIDPW